MNLLRLRAFSLSRRASGLPIEIEEWLKLADTEGKFEKNSSQLGAINEFMDQIKLRIAKASTELESLSRSSSLNHEAFLKQAFCTESAITKANYIWDFFRTKLEQRLLPLHANALVQTDLIAYSCYEGIIPQIKRLNINQKLDLRDYPLTYLLSCDLPITSPITWPKSSQLREIDGGFLPVPIIGIPWDHIRNPWELLSLHHEVSHDIDADLNLPSKELGSYIYSNLTSNGVPQQRAMAWENWTSEVFADFLGILLAGPSFVSFLANYMVLPPQITCLFSPGSPHPAPYLRILLDDQFSRIVLPGLSKEMDATGILDEWNDLYKNFSENANEFVNDFGTVIDVIWNTKLQALMDKKGDKHSLRDIANFTEEDYKRQLAARNCMINGDKIGFIIPIRHIVAAAYMASEHLIKMDDIRLNKELADQLKASIIKEAPKGKLPLRSQQSKNYLRDLANAFFDSRTEGLVHDD